MVMDSGSFEATETYGHAAIKRIVRTLPPIEHAYARVRFSIMRPQLLTVMDLVLPSEGRLLDVGCGFGLFAGYFGLTAPRRSITGVDPDKRRIGIARHVARELGLNQHTFIDGVAHDSRLVGPFQGIYVLDVMHHVPRESQRDLIIRLRDLLSPSGILVIKDVTTEPYLGLKFTEVLDRLVVGFKEPLAYRHHREWGQLLAELGFRVRVVRVPDILPYPHVVIMAHKT
jgi:2-polyprenyl-3-methyl-5-hydroxy-6-metoxy-1,4-benzoquinol methylase